MATDRTATNQEESEERLLGHRKQEGSEELSDGPQLEQDRGQSERGDRDCRMYRGHLDHPVRQAGPAGAVSLVLWNNLYTCFYLWLKPEGESCVIRVTFGLGVLLSGRQCGKVDSSRVVLLCHTGLMASMMTQAKLLY